MKAAFLATAVLATAGVVFHFSTTVNAKASGSAPSAQKMLASKSPGKTISLPLFFEPNQGQTAPQVKFLARGAGYGLFLTADEAVLSLHRPSPAPRTATAPQTAPSSVIRMKLDGANSAASVSGVEPLPGKSNYFIGNDPAKWRHNIPQFARVEYKSVYPGVDLDYYGDQGQLEYDFRVAPGTEPSQIALTFQGASTRIDSGDSGELILSTANGDVRFHAPRVYQPAAPQSGTAFRNTSRNTEKAIAGSFRQLADNKIGFTIGDYDHSRELVIDPVLSYSTYFGGSNGVDNGKESSVNVAVDSSGYIYLAGSTDSDDLPFPPSTTSPAPIQGTRQGAQNVFIAVINPNPNVQQGGPQLLYSTYLGGSGSDYPAGIAVSTDVDQVPGMGPIDIYVAGTTSSPNFPVSTSDSGGLVPFQPGPPTDPGNHGFVTRLNVSAFGEKGTSTLRYSTYLAGTNLAGNATDTVTGLAIDGTGDAFVTGTTTSTDAASNGFPANPNAFQTQSNAPTQLFASKIDTKISGTSSMIYSTYFGGGSFDPTVNPLNEQAVGGGIAVDSGGNMYFTGGTNFLGVTSGSYVTFPLLDAQQSCLNACDLNAAPGNTDAFAAKINPFNASTASLIYSTYLGGSGNDVGTAIAVDTSGNAHVTGKTTSGDWASIGNGFQTSHGGVPPYQNNAFIAKIGNLTGSVYPLNYFSYLGGSGSEVGQAIQVDSLQAVHVVGSTTSTNLPVTTNTLQPCLGEPGVQPPCPPSTAANAFVALISTTSGGTETNPIGDYVTYLGGTGPDQGTGIAIDINGNNATYVAGTTQSQNFPLSASPNPLPYQGQLNGNGPNAFVSKLGANSRLTVFPSTTSPSPFPVAAGIQVAFTFDIANNGPDFASTVTFTALSLPTTMLATPATAKVTSGTGSCQPVQGPTITCTILNLSVCSTTPCTSASVEVDVTPSITTTAKTIQISGQAIANNSGLVAGPIAQTPAPIVDFTVTAATPAPINAGDTATIPVAFCPTPTGYGYPFTITPSQTDSNSLVTATTPIFTPTTVEPPGNSCGGTTLSIATVPRPAVIASLFRRDSWSLYAAWIPISGLSLIGLGIGAGRKRRRWLAAIIPGLIAGAILLQSGCGSSSSTPTTGGGTQPGTYTITITGSAGSAASHVAPPVYLTVN